MMSAIDGFDSHFGFFLPQELSDWAKGAGINFFLLIPNELRTGGAGLMTSPPSWKRLIIGLHFCGF
jgi:hypothetical protein